MHDVCTINQSYFLNIKKRKFQFLIHSTVRQYIKVYSKNNKVNYIVV